MDKRHFTVVIGSKEHGLYISSKPSSAAKKVVSKLCASNKSKKVEFSLREITQGSKKKTYGPYLGEMKKLKKPIELKGRVIRHEIKLHLKKMKSSTTKPAKKMRGGHLSYSQLGQLIERNNFQEILDAIFDGNLELFHIYRMLEFNEKFIIDMINYVNLLRTNENKNKYFFIICDIILYDDKDNMFFDYLISQIGIDKFIEIVYGTDYGTAFNRIIRNIQRGNNIKFDIDKIDINKYLIFIKLLDIYSKKMSLEEFKELLIKLFSIRDKSFMINNVLVLQELFNFFAMENNYPKINSSFRLLDFLLENKEILRDFIGIFKKFVTESPQFIDRGSVRSKIGTKQTQDDLFRNINP